MPSPKKKSAAKKSVKKTSPKKSAPKPVKKQPAPPSDWGEALDKLPPAESEAAFAKFIAIARDQQGPIERYRGGVLTMLSNARRAVESLQAREAEIAAELPQIDRSALWDVPALVLALGFAVRAKELESPDGSLPALSLRLYELRSLLLTNAEGLATAGLLNHAEVDKIRAGFGKMDAAQDCISLSALYRRHAAAIRGKTPVSAAQVREAGEVGAQVLKLLRPARSKGGAAGPSEAARDRDLLYTLLLSRYHDLRRVGMYLWMEAVDAHVPALFSRAKPGRPRKTKAPQLPANPPPK